MEPDSLEYIKPDTVSTDTVAQMPNYIDSIFSMPLKLWHGEVSVSGLGEIGDPIPYAIMHDDFIIITLIACCMFSVIIWLLSRDFLSYQLFNIFHTPREGSSQLRETERQKNFLWYYGLQWCILAAMMLYTCGKHLLWYTFHLPSWTTIGIFATAILLCNMLQSYVRHIPHAVYFERKQLRMYHTEHITFMGYYGIVVLPFAICAVFMESYTVLIAEMLLTCLVFVKILEIYKVYSIFFQKKRRFLQFFLYLCTLEAVPILLTVGILTLTTMLMSQT